MKTRTKKTTKATASKTDDGETKKSSIATLAASVEEPPHLFILPEDTSSEARIVTLPNPATASSSRYLVCPEKGFYEFTRIAAPKKACRSWLLAPHEGQADQGGEEADEASGNGYILEKPEMFVATPIDPLFIILPLLCDGEQGSYLTFSDYIYDADKPGREHLHQLLRQPSFAKLEAILEQRMAVICDSLDMGDGEDRMYQLSNMKLLAELVKKAQKMVKRGLPASMEERFVRQALEVPILSIRREESSISIAADDATPGAESEATSQDTTFSADSSTNVSTAATSVAPTPPAESANQTDPLNSEVAHLLRLRTALSFLQASYVPNSLHSALQSLLASPTSPIAFTPLDAHLSHIADLKKQAQNLRSLSDNFNRKRSAEDDDRAAAKKRKKEEEDAKKKNMSRGVKQLGKVDVSGMKKMSSFFTKKAPAAPTRTSPRKKT